MGLHRVTTGAAAALLLVLGCSPEETGSNATNATGGTPGVGGAGPACAAGQQLCGTVCADTLTDRTNCGACGVVCSAVQKCIGGACQCQAGLVPCGSDCVNTDSTATNCGGCGIACPAGQVCSLGVCQSGCGPGETQCGQDCVVTTSDVLHCGGCNIACGAGRICEGSTCVCPAGQQLCGSGCVDVQTDNAHCGACNNACTGGATCSAGVCVGGGTGGASTGGAPSGGAETGGGVATGGVAAGGTTTGGAPAGGQNTGGAETGGAETGGAETGGAETGGAETGGAPTGGSAGGNIDVPFILGADISNTQQSSSSYVDTDGQTKSIFALLKNHGFNYIRLKTFVDPSAPYGYASSANDCSGLSEPYGDKDHVIAYGQQVKAEGMGFLLDFHYSDVWADPGNQIIPDPWRGASSITELADYVRAYTQDVISSAIAAGARPDMVQVGNEITPGMLMHVPGPNTDCWGNNPDPAPIGGSTSNWDNLATLLRAGIEGVHSVDPAIEIVLHIENHSAAPWWVSSAIQRGVEFDILGISCYTAFQGQPSEWEASFSSLAADYPDLDFIIAEYNPERTAANLIMKNLPNGQGRGTFFWEPTASGEWGEAMFSWQGGSTVANADDFAEYDALLPQLGLQ